ncbi:MAG: Rid family detoxifying hydrolase [Sporolactobacillus sp.]
MVRKIETLDAPQAVGPYSQAVQAGDVVYLSGQIPINPATGQLVEGDVEAQAKQVFQNIEAVLSAAKLTIADVVNVTVYLTDINDFKRVNTCYAKVFTGAVLPARCAVGIAALPLGAALEVACTAYCGN